MNEADTCRELVRPKIETAGWHQDPYSYAEQTTFTDGRIIATSGVARRRKKKRTDFLLRYRRDVALAVVEAKSCTKPVGTGLQQAKDYAEILGLKFAYATNGHEILEYDYLTGQETTLDAYPTPEQLWQRLMAGSPLDQVAAQDFLTPSYHQSGMSPRYYQEIAINRTLLSILGGRKRTLLTMATGTGKTTVAFQICWKLWNARWNRDRAHRRPKMLFLADRNVLVDDPKDKDFAPFGEARDKIEGGHVFKSREMYFAIYQAIARDQNRPGLYKEYPPGFFDLIVVDECHRGSARDDSNWREILDYFEPAFKLGMTATPLRDDNRNTYQYFGAPVYTYSLKQGIEDGFLAPYRVHRVVTTFDAAGWRPSQGQLDKYGRLIPDEEYQTKDFERIVSLKARTKVIAKHLTKHLKRTDRFAKTIVFCVDQEHADEMRRELNNENADLTAEYPDYVCRVTSDEGDIGLGHLGRFQDVETRTPVILTTSRLLTTGVNAPTCKNVVLVRVIESMTEFKQIIGRGTRVRDDYGKLFFSILDYTGSATRMFADPEFDGDPAIEIQVDVDDEGEEDPGSEQVIDHGEDEDQAGETEDGPGGHGPGGQDDDGEEGEDEGQGGPRKLHVEGGGGDVATELEYEMDPRGGNLGVVVIHQYAGDKVRTLYRNLEEFRSRWTDPQQRPQIATLFEDFGVSLDELATAANQADADPFDLLCHWAFNAPLRTRRERAERVRAEKQNFFDQFGPKAREVLEQMLEKYADHGLGQFALPDALEVPPISAHGNVLEIASYFGGPDRLIEAVNQLQNILYAA
jgi:type I restriction enzyme R subunit